MDDVFGPAAWAILEGDTARLTAMLADEPGLATRRSTVGHPTLLQLVACEADNLPRAVESARVLVDAGAEQAGPLVAAAGCGSAAIVDLLLDAGAPIDGDGTWAPLDEAVYWADAHMAERLVARGARIRTLATAAGLGRLDAMTRFFAGDRLRPEAGPVRSPFPDTVPPESAGHPRTIVDHAFVMAVNAGRRAAAEMLIERGADVNSTPPGFHWHGTALHAACWRGDRELVAWLRALGADPAIRDGMVGSDAAGWATHHGHPELLDLLR